MRPRPARETVRRTSSPCSPSAGPSRPSASSRARSSAAVAAGNSMIASTRASSRPARMRSALARPPRSRPSASTMMLLPAPVSPVMTVRPGPSSSSSSSIRANPEMRNTLSKRSPLPPFHVPRISLCGTLEGPAPPRWAATAEPSSPTRFYPIIDRAPRAVAQPPPERDRPSLCPPSRPPSRSPSRSPQDSFWRSTPKNDVLGR